MNPKRIKFFVLLTIILSSLTSLLYLQFPVQASAPGATEEDRAVQTGVRESFIKLPLSFEANYGRLIAK